MEEAEQIRFDVEREFQPVLGDDTDDTQGRTAQSEWIA